VDLDRQAIERRDFPIGRRGYDTASVDAHLRSLATEFEELQRAAGAGGEGSLASAAGSHVQSIVEAAEKAAREIERQALESASAVREEAERDAERTRNDAIEKSRAQVAAVSQVAAGLLQRVGSMDGEVAALMETLRTGAGQLSGDLDAIEKGMGELYDAAAGRAAAPAAAAARAADTANGGPSGAGGDGEAGASDAATPDVMPPVARQQGAPPAATAGESAAQTPAAPGAGPAAAAEAEPSPPPGGDLDGARLIALNMALNGESRADTERYLAENFQLADRGKLVEEVYAAIEG
jgi:DivIVA domain-containing protein